MSRKRGFWTPVQARRWVQAGSLLLFVWLFLRARPTPPTGPGVDVKLFFLADPLLLLLTWATAHVVPVALLGSLGVVGVTLVLGRVFCGWLCPLGTVHALAGRLADWMRVNRRRQERWSGWQRAKYYVLILGMAMALLGGHWLCVLDPMVFLYRSSATALWPACQWAIETSSTAVYMSDPGMGPVRLASVTEPAYEWLRDHLFVVPEQAFLGGALILFLFLATVLLNAWRRRFWCRYLCPLGALLGLCSRRPFLRREVDSGTCNCCDFCNRVCAGAPNRAPGSQWVASECLVCLKCSERCPRHSLRFVVRAPWSNQQAPETVDLSRRAALSSAVGGLAALGLMRITPQARGTIYHPTLIRPPGAPAEREFLKRCTACGLCLKACPTGGLQPALTQAGLEGLWTPCLVPRVGHCDFNCTLCGHVCPTEAIRPLSVAAKQKVRIGLATIDTGRCLPYAFGENCIVCEEHCPIPDKAIYFLEREVEGRDGKLRRVKQPRVDAKRCIGCGICENVCPYRDLPAIRVTSAGESRHPENQPILVDHGPY